jgi:carbohydrate kinase (thermoresistant glucokinase family)
VDLRPNRLLIAGVAGSGKSHVATGVANEFGWAMLDADDLHSSRDVTRMSAGTPLTDTDRWPWLERVAEASAGTPGGLVIACSALRRSYRAFLGERIPGLWICLLQVPSQVVKRRLQQRTDHFMPASLSGSQFAELEPLAPFEHGFTVNGDQDLNRVVCDVVRTFEDVPRMRTAGRSESRPQ